MYISLFLSSFLAATILPFSSEIILATSIINGMEKDIALILASSGNILGAVVNYFAGMLGGEIVLEKYFRTKKEELFKSFHRVEKYGIFALFFAWVPIIGDPLTMAAGVLRVNFPLFFMAVSSGKIARYLFVIYFTNQLR